MSATGPPLDHLTRRLAETPGIFLAEPRLRRSGTVDLAAVITDLLLTLTGRLMSHQDAKRWRPANKGERNLARLRLLCCWVLHDDWFHDRPALGESIEWLLDQGLSELAGIVEAGVFVTDPERREELARRVLAGLRLRPASETEPQAADRLRALDSVERERLLRETRARQEAERARRLKQRMAARQAREAAAKASREW